MPDPLPDDCMHTVDAVIAHGANAVCHVPQAGAWHPSNATVAALFACGALATWALTRARNTRLVLAACLALAALPGLWKLTTARADAPHRAAATAATIAKLHDALAGYTPAAGCAHRARVDCESCMPIVRLALVAPACRTHTTLVVAPGALGGGCTRHLGGLRCGALSTAHR